MRIILTDRNGNPVESAVSEKLHQMLDRVRSSGKLMQDSMLWTVKNHFQTIYPNSKHYSPDKVQPSDVSNGQNPEATIDIDVPGVTRAYHDMDIRPKLRKYLTIPMHREAYGKKASDFSDTFVLTKKNGNKFIVRKDGNNLMFLFNLVKRVFQRQDSRLMPSDQTLADNIFARLGAYLDRTLKN